MSRQRVVYNEIALLEREVDVLTKRIKEVERSWVHVPKEISHSLAQFFGVHQGSKLSFQDIMVRMLIYIGNNNLKVQGGFRANSGIADLFGISVGTVLPYTRLGFYMSNHFEKNNV